MERVVETREIKRAIAKRLGQLASSTHGMKNRRIIKIEQRDGREWQLHATKGWRSYAV